MLFRSGFRATTAKSQMSIMATCDVVRSATFATRLASVTDEQLPPLSKGTSNVSPLERDMISLKWTGQLKLRNVPSEHIARKDMYVCSLYSRVNIAK